jgi:hypothetical protein
VNILDRAVEPRSGRTPSAKVFLWGRNVLFPPLFGGGKYKGGGKTEKNKYLI